MSARISNEDLMRYLDDELDPDDRARVEASIAHDTEIAREVSIYRAIKNDVRDLSFSPLPRDESVWGEVNRAITQPVGWFLMVAGAIIFSVYASIVFVTSDANPWEKIGVGGVVIGFLVLLASAAIDRAREFKTDPYRHIER